MNPTSRIPVMAGTDAESAEHFATNGWVLTDTLGPDGAVEVRRWVEEVAAWPADGGDWIHHRELTETGPALCRTENFTPFHHGLHDLLRTGGMVAIASNLLGEPAVLYKEKINYKLPGGAGYAPHQDAPAYPFIDSHVSCMVAVDDATAANGCLEVVSGAHDRILPMEDGVITAE
ncbi:MAG: phytanoyl-CoA dioxygenase family protein, partial [Actinomycetota bacterium]